MLAMITRNVDLKDAPDLAVLVDLYRQFYGQESSFDDSLSFINDRIYKDDSKIILAVNGDNIIGFTQLYRSYSTVALNHIWILNDLYVIENFRSHGIGYALLVAAKDFALETGAEQLKLETATDNVRAQNLYNDFGFVHSANSKPYHFTLRS